MAQAYTILHARVGDLLPPRRRHRTPPPKPPERLSALPRQPQRNPDSLVLSSCLLLSTPPLDPARLFPPAFSLRSRCVRVCSAFSFRVLVRACALACFALCLAFCPRGVRPRPSARSCLARRRPQRPAPQIQAKTGARLWLSERHASCSLSVLSGPDCRPHRPPATASMLDQARCAVRLRGFPAVSSTPRLLPSSPPRVCSPSSPAPSSSRLQPTRIASLSCSHPQSVSCGASRSTRIYPHR